MNICIVGTDTGIGKTHVSCEILNYLASRNKRVSALKPIACGVVDTEYGRMNEDVYKLYMASNIKLAFEQINPFSLEHAVAPHIAAAMENTQLELKDIANRVEQIIAAIRYDYLLIEGVGGLMVPLNLQETYLDLLRQLNYPVVMVVGMQLGCLNHALLTEASLQGAKLNIVGWVANCTGQMDKLTENLAYLTTKLSMPLLAITPYAENIQPTGEFFKLFECS